MRRMWIPLTAAVLLAVSIPTPVFADSEPVTAVSAASETATKVVIDELTYYLYDTYAEVGATNKSIVTADIAAEVNGVPVTIVRKQGFMMCRNLTKVTIPEGITTLETQAFSGCPLTQVTLPNSLTIIKGNAFSMCTALTELHIPAQVKTIGSCAFSDCSALQKFTIADENPCFSVREDVLYSKDQTTLIWYPTAKPVSSFTIPDTVETINGFAFLHADKLEQITISNTVQDIGIDTFASCTSLQSIAIPSGVTQLSRDLFYNCVSLKEVQIPDTVTTIQDSVFSGCTALQQITLPETVTELGKCTFQNCTALETFTIPEQVTKLEDNLFTGCSSLKSIVVPASVTEIGEAVFSQCSSLEEITILNPNCVLFDDAETICNTLAEDSSPIFSGIISGYEGSTAQAYAEKYGLRFHSLGEAFAWETGDVNLDGTVTMADVVILQKYLLRKQPLTLQQGQVSDMNGDHAVQVLDLVLLKRQILK